MRPSHAFFLAGRFLCRDRECAGFTPHNYQRARQRAERLARQRALPRDDCTFEEIFASFPELDRWGIPVQAAMDAELNAERTLMRPVAANIADVKQLQTSGAKVLFLSDMYLPRWFVLELLETQGISIAPETLFLSGELGLSKRTGRLFSFVLEYLGIPPEALHHVGDNSWSDVVVPQRLGITTTQTKAITPTRYEQLPRPRRFAGVSRSVLGGIARASRLEAATADADPAWSAFGCNVAGPLLCGYVRWVLDHARSRGITRLYFVSRDGQPLYKIALAIAGPRDPECRYLYGSRRAWLLPSVIRPDAASLAWAWTKGTYFSAADILRRLELDTPEVSDILLDYGFTAERISGFLDEDSASYLKRVVLETSLAEHVLARAAIQRGLLLDYLRQEGLMSDTSWALVDVGWKLRPQQALHHILSFEDAAHRTRGYYLGLAVDHMPLDACGDVWAYISHPQACVESRFRCRWLVKRATIALMENAFLAADHPSVIGYRTDSDRVLPVFDSSIPTTHHRNYAVKLHRSLSTYARNLSVANAFGLNFDVLAWRSLAIVKEFAFAPTRQEAEAFSWLQSSPDQGHSGDRTYCLARPLTVIGLLHLVIQDLGLFRANKPMPFFWLHGSLALSSRPTRILAELLKLLNIFVVLARFARTRLRKSTTGTSQAMFRPENV